MSFNQENLLRTAFDSYLLQLDEFTLEPAESYLPYDFRGIDAHRWRTLGNEMVKDELRELTNRLNRWHKLLRQWDAWNTVIEPYGIDEAWELRGEFLEALVHHCLLMPSSIRDTLTFVATNSMHQVRLMTCEDYPDYLEGDPKQPDEKLKYPTRRQKEARLTNLISIWSEASQFMASLRKIDDQPYRDATSDYRNRNSHAIGPRLGIGMTRAVVRSVKQATTLSKQSNGTYASVPVPGRMSVCYGFGGAEPLDMEIARIASLDQYRRARECYTFYLGLLDVGLESMPSIRSEK